jgi:hypothetical protein
MQCVAPAIGGWGPYREVQGHRRGPRAEASSPTFQIGNEIGPHPVPVC